ncbi:MAG TPA: flagellar hook capping FlgD N-terminal domain-containing protein [Bryobacterales bacterium]|jgi:flagellar basal-body rod modification protein FlgD|nr:flagellar hook capping FlgD N-terminal domain-containing protein [Bryobacterales bacterium]
MTTTTALPPLGSGAAGNPAAGSISNPKTQAGTDTFLQLLVAELKTQDPLDPEKGTDFVTQLAQFNSLEQLISINGNLQALVSEAGSGGAASQNSPAAGQTNK